MLQGGLNNHFIYGKSGEFQDSKTVGQMLKTCNEFGDALKIYAGHLKWQKNSDADDS